MMAAQSYHGGGEHDAFYRSNGRAMPPTQHYDRTPYSYYEPRRDVRADQYHGMHTAIHEDDDEAAGPQSRRRIAVACGRCRRRKIKCSGDPGDGTTGCQACRNAGAQSQCTFMRIGARPVAEVEMMANVGNSAAIGTEHGYDSQGVTYGNRTHSHHLHTRASLPTLHTVGSFHSDYDSQYDHSPVDAYTYGSAALSRQDTYPGAYNSAENFRSYPSGVSMSAPATSGFYEPQQHNTYSFGSLQAPAYPQTTSGRLPSVTAESMSALNMGSLQSSLPLQAVQERRLPVPYTIQYPPPQPTYQGQALPEIRPLEIASFRPQAHINGVHSRTAMPWTSDRSPSGSSRNNSINPHTTISPIPVCNSHSQPATTVPMTEPVLGYQFPQTNVYSPDVSPTNCSHVNEVRYPSNPATSSSLQPNSNLRYSTISSATPLPPIADEEQLQQQQQQHQQRPSSRQEAAASLYSFSTEASEQARRSTTTLNAEPVREANGYARPESSYSRSSVDSGGGNVMHHAHAGYAPLRQPQPQHAASLESLRRQGSFEQQQQQQAQQQAQQQHQHQQQYQHHPRQRSRARADQRTSVPSLDARY